MGWGKGSLSPELLFSVWLGSQEFLGGGEERLALLSQHQIEVPVVSFLCSGTQFDHRIILFLKSKAVLCFIVSLFIPSMSSFIILISLGRFCLYSLFKFTKESAFNLADLIICIVSLSSTTTIFFSFLLLSLGSFFKNLKKKTFDT